MNLLGGKYESNLPKALYKQLMLSLKYKDYNLRLACIKHFYY